MGRKLTMQSLARSNLKHRRKQYTSLVAAVVLAMVFCCGVPFFMACNKASIEELSSRELGKQDVLILDADENEIQHLQDSGYLEGQSGYMHVISYGWTGEKEKGTAVGWLDEQAAELYHLQLREGRMPAAPGEIAVEYSTLFRLGLADAKPGNTIMLHEIPANGVEYLPQTEDKTYTLVGIVENRKVNLERAEQESRYKTTKVPSAFVVPGTQTSIGGKENLIALGNQNRDYEKSNLAWKEQDRELQPRMLLTRYYSSKMNSAMYRVMNSTKISGTVALLMAILSCFGICNAFASNLNERKKQIGMLRAVGATRRQILQIFGQEALLIALVCAPVSVMLAWGGVKLFAFFMGEYFVFLPSMRILLEGVVFGVVAVVLAALVPLWFVSRIPPMRAIRDTELVRKMKRRRVHSQKKFRMDQLLAKRKLLFQQGRMAAVSLILAFTMFVLNLAVGHAVQWQTLMQQAQQERDYQVGLNGWTMQKNPCINEPTTNDTIRETQRQEALQLPYVQEISGEKHCTLNLLFDGPFPEYLLLNELTYLDGLRFSHWEEKLHMPNSVVTPENFDTIMQADVNPEYDSLRQWAGYEQNVKSVQTLVKSEAFLAAMEESVVEGRIDLEKLNTGEEILLNAPAKIGFYFRTVTNGYQQSLLDITETGLRKMNTRDKEKLEYLLAEAESPFHAGDTLTLSMLVKGPDGQPIRMDREVKIGAILNQNSDMELYTTVQGLDQFGQTFGYDQVDVLLDRPVTEKMDQEVQPMLEAVFPGKAVQSWFETKQLEIQNFMTSNIIAATLILTLCVVSVTLVNNSISGQIREGKRTIGTLRAVGASQRDIVRSYVWQILAMTVAGTLLGIAGYTVLQGICYYWYEETLGTFVLWPTPLLFCAVFGICWLHLVRQVRKISCHSIVENIREL